jgi:multidrug efflux pump subunit AcrA (membrane-fusion protein)
MTRRWRWGGAAIAGAALLGVSAAMLRPRPEVQVESARVTTGPIARRILATGTVQAVTGGRRQSGVGHRGVAGR